MHPQVVGQCCQCYQDSTPTKIAFACPMYRLFRQEDWYNLVRVLHSLQHSCTGNRCRCSYILYHHHKGLDHIRHSKLSAKVRLSGDPISPFEFEKNVNVVKNYMCFFDSYYNIILQCNKTLIFEQYFVFYYGTKKSKFKKNQSSKKNYLFLSFLI